MFTYACVHMSTCCIESLARLMLLGCVQEKELASAEPKELELDAQCIANAVSLATEELLASGISSESREAGLEMSTAIATAGAEASLKALDFAYFTRSVSPPSCMASTRSLRSRPTCLHHMSLPFHFS